MFITKKTKRLKYFITFDADILISKS